ncbi:hypothetical protein LQK80_00530 [Bacillus thuringiensis]|nr:hypothetical protein [Bacillus thuringiensis]
MCLPKQYELVERKAEMINGILKFYDEGKLKVVHNTFIELCELNPYAVRDLL